MLTAKRNALGYQVPALTVALRQGAVGTDDAPPGQVGLVALEEHRSGEARSTRGDVSVGTAEAGWDLADASQDFEQAGLGGRGQLAGPKASMIRFWYSESSSDEMK
jgi:hypothetical protein